MDKTPSKVTLPVVAPEPAFFGPRWNGWVLFVIGLVGIFGFFVAQTAVLILIFFKAHPEVLKYGYLPAVLVSQPMIIKLLTARNLWLVTVTSEIALVILTLVLARGAFGASARTLGLGAAPKGSRVLTGLSAGFGLVVASTIVEALQNAAFGHKPPQFQALVLLTHHGAADFAFDLTAVSVAAPFAEEIFFRGLIFTGLVQRMSPVYAAVTSAALFGAAHFERWSLLPIFVIGLGLAYVFYATKSLWVSMTAHATINTISLVIAYAAPQLVK